MDFFVHEILGAVSNIFYCHLYLGKIPILTSIFFKWVVKNHQLGFRFWSPPILVQAELGKNVVLERKLETLSQQFEEMLGKRIQRFYKGYEALLNCLINGKLGS